jgi:PAS domain S-box-containing protein
MNTDIKILRFEKRLNFFVNQAAVIVTIVDNEGTILYQTSSIQNILGYAPKNRIGNNFLHSRLVHPDDVIVKEKLLKQSYKNSDTNYQGELRMKHKNGAWIWMEVTFNNQIKNPDIGGIVVVTHDITERKRVELQKNEFLSIASHELRTPLTVIRAYSQVLLARFAKEKITQKEIPYLEKIVSQTNKIAKLINELFDLSKIQEGKLSVYPRPFHIYRMMRKVIEDFTYIAQSRTINLVGNANIVALGDEEKIRQVMNNLLTNAIKYSPPSGEITIHVAKEGKEIVTSVTDKGKGIPMMQQKYVFNRFFRIEDGSSSRISAGLGLYIASEIMKLHKGRIWLKSKKGQGSTFYFSLPVASK